MSVRSRPTTPRAKQSAIVSREALDRQRGAFERFSAFAVLLLSFAGTIAALSGGWSALRDAPQLAPILGGIVLQTMLTVVQWWYGAGRGVWVYRISLCIDASLTAWGYGPLFVPWIAAYLASKGTGQVAEVVAWLIVGVVSFLVARYPERHLID